MRFSATAERKRKTESLTKSFFQFEEFDRGLNKREPELIYSDTRQFSEIGENGKVDIRIHNYDFKDGFRVFRERHEIDGELPWQNDGPKGTEFRPYHDQRTFYFIMRGNKIVTDEAGALKLIREHLGVELSSLEVDYMGRHYGVVLSIHDYSKPDA